MSIHPVMQRLADKLKRTDLPEFVPGDQIRVQVKIKEGDKERLQAFEGLVIAINRGPQGTFTVRKMSFGQGVERIFPFNSKVVDKIEKIRSYRVRRAKLFYIRGLRGKAARLKRSGPRHRQSPRLTRPPPPKSSPQPLRLGVFFLYSIHAQARRQPSRRQRPVSGDPGCGCEARTSRPRAGRPPHRRHRRGGPRSALRPGRRRRRHPRPRLPPHGSTDSKKLSEKKRIEFDVEIRANAVAWAIAAVDAETIDRINIRQASLLAMRRAVVQLALSPDYLLIDGRDTIDWHCPQQAVIQGDSTSLSIAAASVLAKVHRDRLLVEFDREFPGYGLAQHKGYPCPAHKAALERLGPTPLHRKSYHPVAQALLQ